MITWKSKFTFGKYAETETNPGATLLSVLITDKPYLSWCFKEHLDEKYNELVFIRENIKPKEWNEILKAGG